MIDSTARIDSKAQIGTATHIGPGVIIEGPVIIGRECEIRAHAVITGHTRIGSKNQIGYGAIIGAEPQDKSYKSEKSYVEIGDENIFREYVTIHRGTQAGSATRIGSHNFLMAGAHVAHNCQIGNHVTLVNNVLLAGHVIIEDHAFLGGASVIHQWVRIGKLSMTRGLTRLGKDLPPFMMAVATNSVCGINRVGLRRRGFSIDQRKAILRAYNILYKSGLNRTQALEEIAQLPALQTPDIDHLCGFISTTKRGICKAILSGERKEEID